MAGPAVQPHPLLARVRRTFGTATPDQALQRARAIVGTSRLPDNAEGGLAKAGLEALQNGDEPTPRQLAALEMMLRIMRPARLIRGGEPDPLTRDFEEMFPDWDDFREKLKPFARSIGRIDSVEGESFGTGFLVDSTTLVTNRHVLDQVSKGTRKLESGQCVVRFVREFGTPDADPVPVLGVKKVHESLDLALLEVPAQELLSLSIAAAAPKAGDPVVAIGFPFQDSERNPLWVGTIFGSRFGVKRAAPGDVVSVAPHKSEWGHDCSTLGGNSGSPVVSMRTAELLGVHSGGGFLWRNQAVDSAALLSFLHG